MLSEVLPDYLGGIETKSICWTAPLSCFQTTYEELKRAVMLPMPLPTKSLPDYLWGIETTFFQNPKKLSLRFQTTYEELKHELWPPGAVAFVSASRLPMRNWNWNKPIWRALILVWLPDYLWGIETSELPDFQVKAVASRLPMRNWNLFAADQSNFSSSKLPDYLWGIETQFPCVSFLPPLPCFQTTYEELKLSSSTGGSWGIYGFQTTYEELKQILQSRNWRDGAASRLPMRNWNQGWKILASLPYFPLPDYLWGIETGPV